MDNTGQLTASPNGPFLRAIVAAPDDDLPRLIAADWLDEHGEPERAEFIRLQIDLAKYPGNAHAAADSVFVQSGRVIDGRNRNVCPIGAECSLCPLRRRGQKLLEGHGGSPGGRMTNWGEWLDIEPLRHICRLRSRPWRETVTFRRGFVSEITCAAADWPDHADAILAACPIRNARDGLVILTDWPVVHCHRADEGGPAITVGSDGYTAHGSIGGRPRRTVVVDCPAGVHVSPETLVPAFLEAEWPGVRFQLPNRMGGLLHLNGTVVGVMDVTAPADGIRYEQLTIRNVMFDATNPSGVPL